MVGIFVYVLVVPYSSLSYPGILMHHQQQQQWEQQGPAAAAWTTAISATNPAPSHQPTAAPQTRTPSPIWSG